MVNTISITKFTEGHWGWRVDFFVTESSMIPCASLQSEVELRDQEQCVHHLNLVAEKLGLGTVKLD